MLVLHGHPSTYAVTLAPRPRLRAVLLRRVGGLGAFPCAAVPAPAAAVAAFWAVISSNSLRPCSAAAVCSKKVLNCSSVSVMLSGSSFSKNSVSWNSGHEAFCQVIFLFIDALSFGRGTDRQEERALTRPVAV